MSELAIRCEGLSKRYKIGRRENYKSLRDSVANAFGASLSRVRSAFGPAAKSRDNSFWALKDVSFDIQQGEVVGIIGRNGAGKSTLLKILSRITEPTAGGADINGRVGSLLEVGTGFHPELTGRENIFLNGAILGMGRAVIKAKFDEIVAFAEIEKFVDTPVKRYSSGMYTRLAFAVAAHMEPDILLVDEVLAVGDSTFQKKCLGKMENLGSSGRTVLFVSHSMPNILRLCGRVILLSHGGVLADGSPTHVTRQYLNTQETNPAEVTWPGVDCAPGDGVARLHSVHVRNQEGEVSESIDIRQPICVEVNYWNLQSELRPTISLWFVNQDGVCLFVSNDFNNQEWWGKPRSPGLVTARCSVPGNFFAEGQVFLTVAVSTYNPNIAHVMERDVVSFQVVDQSEGDGVRGVYAGDWPGVLRPMLDWKVETKS